MNKKNRIEERKKNSTHKTHHIEEISTQSTRVKRMNSKNTIWNRLDSWHGDASYRSLGRCDWAFLNGYYQFRFDISKQPDIMTVCALHGKSTHFCLSSFAIAMATAVDILILCYTIAIYLTTAAVCWIKKSTVIIHSVWKASKGKHVVALRFVKCIRHEWVVLSINHRIEVQPRTAVTVVVVAVSVVIACSVETALHD